MTPTHVHYRPGGAVFDAACRCADPEGWPVELGSSDSPPPSPEPADRYPAARAERWQWVAVIAARVRAGVRWARGRGWFAVRTAGGAVVGALRIFGAVVRGLGNGAQVAGVGMATWAAWEWEPVAGKLVLAAGLLFLGGAVGRVVREVRNGTR